MKQSVLIFASIIYAHLLFAQTVTQNKEKTNTGYNKALATMLDSIYIDDQQYRKQIDDIEKKYGAQSQEIKDHWKIIREKDSINLIKVKSILDNDGWLGPAVVGIRGNEALFLVIQHADAATQEKYLPMMRKAVKNGQARGSSLALLEDRVAIRKGKRQIYGSQVGRDPETQAYFVFPLDDPENVDKRRAEVGLGPLAAYVSNWQIKWDAKQYKKDLKKLEKKLKKK